MQPIELAERHMRPFSRRGDQIVPKHCPFCRGGDHGDRESFAMHIVTGAWNCKRASCSESGGFRRICEHFGEKLEPNREWREPPKREYTEPKTKTKAPESKVATYLKNRGFSPETWQRRGVTECAAGTNKGCVAMPYYESGKLVLMKFRDPWKDGRKGIREPGGRSVFWGMDECTPDLPLVIVEGEMDALACDEAGVPNVVSVPSGAQDLTCIDNCWDWLQQFDRIVIWPDQDDPGREAARNIARRAGEWRCWIVDCPDQKDANDVLRYDGARAVRELVDAAREVPMAGIIRLADVKPLDLTEVPRTPSTISNVNEMIGGYRSAELTVWTGVNGSGKSTLLGQELLGAVDHGHAVCCYSGELKLTTFRYWVDLQAAGPSYTDAKWDPVRNDYVPRVNPQAAIHIRDWYRDLFYMYDRSGPVDGKNLMDVFEYAARRYGCRVFAVDNLMSILAGTPDREYYRKQSDFVQRLKDFAEHFDVHVHLVAHPHKTQGRVQKNNISGSGDITNWADNVVAVHRMGREDGDEGRDCDAVLEVLKSRMDGKEREEVDLYFDPGCKRFYRPTRPEERFTEFGWVRGLEAERFGEDGAA